MHLPGEAPAEVRPADHDPVSRTDWLRREAAVAVLAHSSPLGVEDLPVAQSRALLDAYHDGVADGPGVGAGGGVGGAGVGAGDVDAVPRLGWWAALPRGTVLGDPRFAQRALVGLLDRGAAGLQVPATWLRGPQDVVALEPLLATVQEADRPLFIHPGRAEAGSSDRPAWWAPVVDYSAQMAAAWWAWHAAARPGLGDLRVCFAAGAGLAPVHHERLRARGGVTTVVDPHTYVDLSGYGPQAFDALLRALGIDGLISASDHPYAAALGIAHDPAADRAIRHTNPHRLMFGGTR